MTDERNFSNGWFSRFDFVLVEIPVYFIVLKSWQKNILHRRRMRSAVVFEISSWFTKSDHITTAFVCWWKWENSTLPSGEKSLPENPECAVPIRRIQSPKNDHESLPRVEHCQKQKIATNEEKPWHYMEMCVIRSSVRSVWRANGNVYLPIICFQAVTSTAVMEKWAVWNW